MPSRGFPPPCGPACRSLPLVGPPAGEAGRAREGGQTFFNSLKNPIHVPAHFMIPKPDHFKPLSFQPLISSDILLVLIVLSAINFDNHLFIKTYKIDNISADDRLSAKFNTQTL